MPQAYDTIEKLFYKDASAERFSRAERIARERLEAESPRSGRVSSWKAASCSWRCRAPFRWRMSRCFAASGASPPSGGGLPPRGAWNVRTLAHR